MALLRRPGVARSAWARLGAPQPEMPGLGPAGSDQGRWGSLGLPGRPLLLTTPEAAQQQSRSSQAEPDVKRQSIQERSGFNAADLDSGSSGAHGVPLVSLGPASGAAPAATRTTSTLAPPRVTGGTFPEFTPPGFTSFHRGVTPPDFTSPGFSSFEIACLPPPHSLPLASTPPTAPCTASWHQPGSLSCGPLAVYAASRSAFLRSTSTTSAFPRCNSPLSNAPGNGLAGSTFARNFVLWSRPQPPPALPSATAQQPQGAQGTPGGAELQATSAAVGAPAAAHPQPGVGADISRSDGSPSRDSSGDLSSLAAANSAPEGDAVGASLMPAEGAIRAPVDAESVRPVDDASMADASVAAAESASEIAAATADAWLPTAALQHCIFGLHTATGWPWWLSIVAMTLAVRAVMFPLMVFQMRMAARHAEVAPTFVKLHQRLKAYNYAPEEMERYQTTVKALMKKHKVNPLAPFLGAFVQASTFIFFYFSILGLAKHVPSMASGGTLWFSDLSASDPTHVLPVLTGLSMLVSVELGSLEGMEMQQQQNMKNMRMFMRGMAFVSVPITASFPQALFCYMIPNSFVSIALGFLLKDKSVRSRLGLPPVTLSKSPQSSSSPSLFPPNTSDQQPQRAARLGAPSAPVPPTARTALPPERASALPQHRRASGRRRGFHSLAWDVTGQPHHAP